MAKTAAPMTEIDIDDDGKLRFIQRVLEGNPPQSDKDDAAQMVRDLRRRIRKVYSTQFADMQAAHREWLGRDDMQSEAAFQAGATWMCRNSKEQL